MGKLETRGVVYYILVIKLNFLFKKIDQSTGKVEGILLYLQNTHMESSRTRESPHELWELC